MATVDDSTTTTVDIETSQASELNTHEEHGIQPLDSKEEFTEQSYLIHKTKSNKLSKRKYSLDQSESKLLQSEQSTTSTSAEHIIVETTNTFHTEEDISENEYEEDEQDEDFSSRKAPLKKRRIINKSNNRKKKTVKVIPTLNGTQVQEVEIRCLVKDCSCQGWKESFFVNVSGCNRCNHPKKKHF